MRILLVMGVALLMSNCINGQPLVGMGAGYTSANSPVVNLQLGLKVNNSLVYYNQLIHTSRNINTPQILGLRYGYNIGSFQPNAGIDYHMFSSDKYRIDKRQQGFHFAFGITKYFENLPLKIDIGMSSKLVIASIGMYKIID